MSEAPGQLVAGQYQLIEEIGRGGFGVVWRARHERLGRDVAAKKLFLPAESAALAADQWRERSHRTFREARSAARIDHPAAVKIYDVVEHRGDPWIIMELIEGRSLNAVVRSEGPLPPSRVAEIGLEIVGALTAAHAAGVVHRDVNPANVLISDRRAVLTDFGIAVIQGDPSLTHTGVIMGAPAYTAPERARGEDAVPASDLWSLGATLFYAVEGRRPFPGANPNAVLYSILTEDPPPAERAGPLTPVIQGLLHREVAGRLTAAQTAGMLKLLLKDDAGWLDPAPVTTVTPTSTEDDKETDPLAADRRNSSSTKWRLASAVRELPRRRALIAAAAPVAALALVGVLLRNGDPPPKNNSAVVTPSAPPAAVRLITSFPGERAFTLAFSHDGRTLAVGGDDRVVHLWDVARRKSAGALRGHKYTIFSLAFSPDDRTIASGSYDGRVILWNAADHKSKGEFETDGNGVGSMAFSPDGTLLACAGSDAVRLWNTAAKTWKTTLRAPSESTFTTAYSRQGRLAVGGSATIRLWDTKATPATSVTLTKVSSVVSSLAFSTDGRTLAAGGYDGRVRLWNTATRASEGTLTGHDKSISAVAFDPRGRVLASAGGSSVLLWNAATGKRLPASIKAGDSVVNAIAFSPDGRVLATGGDDGTVRLWSIPAP
ncbi:serine/threonine protein kinase [Actinomadura barringtoniae]|uniref:Serine/threonine protein kinase n=1 Tax=Actinomadura barringtoniae TaxID=1427535 RepID=A0A939PKM2_9ACTN|nr:serine/threonine-protein kinase [Actinomadura barringtoniae]MBO2454037.1 serine/threonine protein kinase [Actinomadura barringtoniae]